VSQQSTQKILSATAAVDAASVAPFPNSQKIYVQGSRPDIRVPMREVSLTPTPVLGADGSQQFEHNPPVRVYDTSGPYSDPAASIDVRKGLAAVRDAWIEERNDSFVLPNESSIFTRERLHDPETAHLRFELLRKPRKAKPGKNVSQMHYARQGIITPEMEYIAIRENMALAQAREQGVSRAC
jgi:phosphomethylpyrimidine synthase